MQLLLVRGGEPGDKASIYIVHVHSEMCPAHWQLATCIYKSLNEGCLHAHIVRA